MKKTKITAVALCAAALLMLVSCADKDEGGVEGLNLEFAAQDMSELDGTWMTARGDKLYFDSEGGFYAFSNFAGRTGRGTFEEADGKPMIEFDGFMYDFYFSSNILRADRNGSGDAESLEGLDFTIAENEDIVEFGPENYDGLWQNANGETLVFDSSLMQYISCSKAVLGSGTINDENDGKGLYLFLDERAYICPAPDGNSFTLLFAKGEERDFHGVFYRAGNVSAYADLSSADTGFKEFTYTDGMPDEIWYNDGVNYYYVGEASEYEIRDGRAYDSEGNVFGAGWDDGVYDPAEDWGDTWSENWD